MVSFLRAVRERYVGYGSCFITAIRVASARLREERAERAGVVSSMGHEPALEGWGRERRCVNIEAEVRRLPEAWLKRSWGSVEGEFALGQRT